MPVFTLEQIAEFVNGTASSCPGPSISGAKPLEYAGSEDITYIAGPQFLSKLEESSAGAVLIPPDLDYRLPFIKTANPETAFAKLTQIFYPHPKPEPGISPHSVIHPEATLSENVSIGAFVVIEEGVQIGSETVIGHHAVIGENTYIGNNVRIFPHVTIYPHCRIRDDAVIHSGCVIGADGFGYAHEIGPNGVPVLFKKHHSGSVDIGENVELGALTAVDRALAGTTKIGSNAKIDNLVQIAHNVEIGQGTVIASQVGIAGSSKVGSYCLIGGQAGIRDHVSVGDGVMLATRVGIYRNVPSGSAMAGSVPAMPHKIFLRVQNLFKRLPELLDRIRKLEEKLSHSEKDK